MGIIWTVRINHSHSNHVGFPLRSTPHAHSNTVEIPFPWTSLAYVSCSKNVVYLQLITAKWHIKNSKNNELKNEILNNITLVAHWYWQDTAKVISPFIIFLPTVAKSQHFAPCSKNYVLDWMTVTVMMGMTSSMQTLGQIYQRWPAAGANIWCLYVSYLQDCQEARNYRY